MLWSQAACSDDRQWAVVAGNGQGQAGGSVETAHTDTCWGLETQDAKPSVKEGPLVKPSGFVIREDNDADSMSPVREPSKSAH